MKTATTIIHVTAFACCFAVYVGGTGELKSGVRRALQTMAAATVEMPAAPAAEMMSTTDAA